jgi:hypothetical protein
MLVLNIITDNSRRFVGVQREILLTAKSGIGPVGSVFARTRSSEAESTGMIGPIAVALERAYGGLSRFGPYSIQNPPERLCG